jgi:hypothetical protein
MREVTFRKNASLPRLAWCAQIVRSSPTVLVEHGAWVETRPDGFIEGVWNGPFTLGDFSRAEVVLGSGGRLQGENLLFTPTTHTMERLYSMRLGDKLLVSNSLVYLLEATESHLDLTDWSHERALMTFLRGYKRATPAIRIANGRSVRLHYHQTVAVDPSLSLRALDQPEPPAFTHFQSYVDYLVEMLAQLVDNGADQARSVRYEPLATISSGYDSPACAVLAKRVGCRRTVTFGTARQAFERRLESTDDSGEAIARLLELEVATYSRDAYLHSAEFPEVPFIATGSGGDDVILSALTDQLERSMLFTGMLGDTLWGTAGQDPAVSREYRFRFPAGGSLQEYRLSVGFLHVPIPLLTFTRHAEIQAISRSEEMLPWRLGGAYDRPIPRRLIEEAGVPRAAFAREKKAITQPFWLQKATPACMSAASLADFRDFAARASAVFPLGEVQMRAQALARRALYKARRLSRRVGRPDPYHSHAYDAAATAEPLRFHWAIEKRRSAYRSTTLRELH